jgi:hypothetical protein
MRYGVSQYVPRELWPEPHSTGERIRVDASQHAQERIAQVLSCVERPGERQKPGVSPVCGRRRHCEATELLFIRAGGHGPCGHVLLQAAHLESDPVLLRNEKDETIRCRADYLVRQSRSFPRLVSLRVHQSQNRQSAQVLCGHRGVGCGHLLGSSLKAQTYLLVEMFEVFAERFQQTPRRPMLVGLPPVHRVKVSIEERVAAVWRAFTSLKEKGQPNGRRISRTAAGRTKTEAKNKLKQLLRDKDDGIDQSTQPTVADALEEWLRFGLSGRSSHTVTTCNILTKKHIIPELGPRKLQDLTADDVDHWLAKKSLILSTATLQRLLSILRRAINREQARDHVRRNVARLCGVPTRAIGRPSKSLNLEQAKALLTASIGSPVRAYIVLSLLTGARTEELRALTWAHVDLIGRPENNPPTPPSIELWRSVREGGDTKTRLSRRTLSFPICVSRP